MKSERDREREREVVGRIKQKLKVTGREKQR